MLSTRHSVLSTEYNTHRLPTAGWRPPSPARKPVLFYWLYIFTIEFLKILFSHNEYVHIGRIGLTLAVYISGVIATSCVRIRYGIEHRELPA